MRKLENYLSTNYPRIFHLKQIFNDMFINLKELIFFLKKFQRRLQSCRKFLISIFALLTITGMLIICKLYSATAYELSYTYLA